MLADMGKFKICCNHRAPLPTAAVASQVKLPPGGDLVAGRHRPGVQACAVWQNIRIAVGGLEILFHNAIVRYARSEMTGRSANAAGGPSPGPWPTLSMKPPELISPGRYSGSIRRR
jgi:hypothetical protein